MNIHSSGYRSRCYDPGTLAVIGVVMAGASAGSSVMGGMAAQKSANQEAELQREQGDQALAEAKVNADNEAFNQSQAVGKQRLAFLANGVSLEGSPTTVLEESRKYGQSAVDAIIKQGVAQKNLSYGQAQITKNQGRAALIAGYGQAAGTIAGGISTANKSGVFDPTKPTTTTKK